MNIPNEKNKSILYFQKAIVKVSDKYKEGYFTEIYAPKEAYLLYGRALRINGELHRRTLLAQNPNSTDDNGQLKTWAREARAGAKIMFILGDEKNGGVRAKIKLDAMGMSFEGKKE